MEADCQLECEECVMVYVVCVGATQIKTKTLT